MRVESAQGVTAKELNLPDHHARPADLVDARGKVAMPEERQLFQQRVRREQHPPQPPGAGGFQVVGSRFVFIVGLVESGHVAFGMQQAVDRPLRAVGNRPLEFVPGGAECGPAKQVARPAQIPGPLGIRLIGRERPLGIGRPAASAVRRRSCEFARTR